MKLATGLLLGAVLVGQQAFAVQVPQFKKVVVVILENTGYDNAIKQPFLGKLAKDGALLTKSAGVAHPSQPNYIAMTSGSTQGVTNDRNVDIDAKNVADLLEAVGKTWRVYAEGFPGKCYTGSSTNGYYRKHNPFISYLNIQRNAQRCANIVNASQFQTDVTKNGLPDFSFYVPDNNNNGHDTGVAYADRAMSKTFGPIVQNTELMKDTLLIFTFDEDEGGWGPQHIYTAFYGAGVKGGTQSSAAYDHYSILKTLETGFGLGSLGMSDAKATVIDDIWN